MQGTTHEFVTVDANPGFQTFTFNKLGLISATFTTAFGTGQIQTDNFVLNLSALPRTTLVDFKPLTNGGDYMFAGNPYVESGFRFQNELSSNDALFSWRANYANMSADPTGGTLNPLAGGTTTVTRSGGGTFDFLTVDLNDIYNDYYGAGSREVEFAFTDATGTTYQTVTVDANPGFENFAFNKHGLRSMSFTTTFGYGQIQTDNFVFGDTTVPEPASWALMIAGFGMVGGALRSRRKDAAMA